MRMAKSDSYAQFTDVMAREVLGKLNGTHESFDRLEVPDKPSKLIVLGTLGDKSKNYSDNFGDSKRTLTTVKNNSLSVGFLASELPKSLRVSPSASVYYRVYPSLDEQRDYVKKHYEKPPEEVDLARIWKRKKYPVEPIDIPLADNFTEIVIDMGPFINAIKEDKAIFSGGTAITSSCLDDGDSFSKELSQFKGRSIPSFEWKLRVTVQVEEFTQNKETLHLVVVTLVNDTEESKSYETFFFDCHLEIDLNDTEPVPFKYNYEYEGFEHSYENFLRCLNCHADLDRNRIRTRHFSIFRQSRIDPRTSIDSGQLLFEALSTSDGAIQKLEELAVEMESFHEELEKDPRFGEDEKFSHYADGFAGTVGRFVEGLGTLKSNESALRAFELMNKSFRSASTYEGWRIFQIVFIVSLIPDMIDRAKRRDICEVMHVPTAGGKSEAYFACVLFSAFWDRLSGKKFGITAITKFPLRMLSIQQLQRIAGLLVWAEEFRINEDIGGDPFSVAYFVGSTEEFPRHTKKLIDRIKKAKAKDIETPGKIADICPICKDSVVLDYKEKERYIIHRCTGCKREYRLFFTDEEIYRFLPTLIVSTVDKLAGIASNRRFRNIFGGKIDDCPKGHGFIPHNDKCEVGTEDGVCNEMGKSVDVSFGTGPTLVIQDEMHLIREGFGTINSHFESLMEVLQCELSGYGFKNIALTATLTGAREQVEHLYHKGVNVFPGVPPEERGNDFFFEFTLDENKKGVIQRQIIGLKPNLRDNQYSTLLTLRYISEFICRAETDIPSFSTESGISEKELPGIIENYKNILTYHNKKADVHSMNFYLDAVVNSKLDTYQILSKVLTGENTLDYIKELICLIDTYFSKPENKEQLLSVFATSIVSHGVDIDKWNIMAFQGIPRNTSEYIQALSRVGRKHPGLIFVWFYPNRARDLSFYKNFFDYHQILEHQVEDVPISRWAKLGFKQTFTSVFNAAILNYFSSIIDEPLYSVEKVNQVFEDSQNRGKLIDFIKKSYITSSTMVGADYFENKIPEETESRLNYLTTYTGSERHFFPNALKDNSKKYYRTQYGMRGIQDEVVLVPFHYDLPFLTRALR